MNKAILVGNLVRDPELRTTQSGLSVCQFTVACQRRYANAQGVREADFISCVAWRETGEFVNKYFTKGKKIGLTGSIQTRTYDAQDGTKRYVTEVLVDEVEFVTPHEGGNAQGAGSDQQQGHAGSPSTQPKPQQTRMEMSTGLTEVDDDELPF